MPADLIAEVLTGDADSARTARAKNDWGRCWEGVGVAMGVAWAEKCYDMMAGEWWRA